MTRVLVSWSSGKDSAWTLHVLRSQPEYEVVGLVTTINTAADRVAMHAVPVPLLEAQAAAAGLPLWKVPLPYPCSNQQYETAMAAVIARARQDDVDTFAFGDLFLQDIRAYRERQLAGSGVRPLFPIWGQPTDRLARAMVANGLRAILTCVDPKQLSADFAGHVFDAELLAALPPHVDPCGENGEFHTFVYAGPMFKSAIAVRPGAVLRRDGFVFADLVACETGAKR